MGTSATVLLEKTLTGETRRISGRDVDIVVHINEALGEEGLDHLKVALEQAPGVRTARFSANQHHLMLVSYDPDITTSFNILDSVRRQRVHAQLLGPI